MADKKLSFSTGVLVGVAAAFVGGAAFYILKQYRQGKVDEAAAAEAQAALAPQPQPERTTFDYYSQRQSRRNATQAALEARF